MFYFLKLRHYFTSKIWPKIVFKRNCAICGIRGRSDYMRGERCGDCNRRLYLLLYKQ